jgi:8-oxo-dGTP diphosphatase
VKQRATVVCKLGSRILMVSRDGSRWSLPGGKPKSGEDLRDAAVRELIEETGLLAVDMRYVFEFTGVRTRHHVFAAHCAEGRSPIPLNEITRCSWVKVVDVADVPTSVSTKGIVDSLAMSLYHPPRMQSRHQRAEAFVRNLQLALQGISYSG